MATHTLLKIPQEDEIEFAVFVKAASAGQEMVALQFTFGEGLEVMRSNVTNVSHEVGRGPPTDSKTIGI
jgi:hypothetical protein